MSSRHAEKERVSLCGLFEMCTQKIFCRTIGAQTLNELRSQNMLAIPPSSASLLQLRAISYHVEGTPENNNFLRRYHLKNTRRFSATPPHPKMRSQYDPSPLSILEPQGSPWFSVLMTKTYILQFLSASLTQRT